MDLVLGRSKEVAYDEVMSFEGFDKRKGSIIYWNQQTKLVIIEISAQLLKN